MEVHAHHPRVYLRVFFALLLLTALTTAVAYLDLGRAGTMVALAIACTKALLVALFFMELWYRPGLYRAVIVAAVLTFAVLAGLTVADVLTRDQITGF
jgi:cytochrome c oxidase subunit 4